MIELPQGGRNALLAYLRNNRNRALLEWLRTDEAGDYLKELHDTLPSRLELYRGLNGVAVSEFDRGVVYASPYAEEIIEQLDLLEAGSIQENEIPREIKRDVLEADVWNPNHVPIIESWTDDLAVAQDFAEGYRTAQKIGITRKWGIVVREYVPPSSVIYHHEHVDLDSGSARDESEVTVWMQRI